VTDDRRRRTDLPTGTVTFLRTDVEGSMRLAHDLGARWDQVNATHLGLIRRAVDAHGGICVRTEGDAFFGVFPEAGAAVAAAIEAQRALAAYAWPVDGAVRVRMGVHSGEAHLAGDDYGGFEVSRAARIAAAGHGGQVVLSEPTRLLAEAVLTGGVGVHDLGRHVLKDVPAPERLYQVDIPGLRADFPPLRTSQPSAGNLPMRMTSFVGRDRELRELAKLLETARLVTLTGPGGIGKTSLAAELARLSMDAVPDGTWFVELDAITDASLVSAVIARTLGLFDGPDRPAGSALGSFLADRSALLVLDNFEHVLPAAGDVAALLRASPATRIIVTSRAPLRIAAEQEYPVQPLEQRGGTGSVLFMQRARAVRPGWDAGPDAVLVDEICGLLDGLPLGLELAAARVSVLPVRAIRDRLAAHLPLPGSGRIDVPDRQRTLERAIAWSYDLLGPSEQRLLGELAVFEGGFDLDQATAVSGGDVLDGIAALVDQSLLARGVDTGGRGIRFRMLQTIRAFGLDRLVVSGRDRVRRRHAIAYLDLVEGAAPHLPGSGQAEWLDRLELDQANLRAATRWTIDAGEVELALRFVGASWRVWQLGGRLSEGHDLAKAALAMPGAAEPTPARLSAVTAAGGIAYWRAEAAESTSWYKAQLDLAERLGDRAAHADALFNLSAARWAGLAPEESRVFAEEARRAFEALDDQRGMARTEVTRGAFVMRDDSPVQAIPIFEAALATFEHLGDAWYHAIAAVTMAWACFLTGRMGDAVRWLVQSLVETLALRDVGSATIMLPATAIVALEAGRPEDAAVLLGAFEGLSERFGVRPPAPAESFLMVDPYASVGELLDPEELAAALARGRRFSLDEAVALVIRIADTLGVEDQ
jgi:predicted ATPase/class 3 adenylate cyclase